MQLDQTQIAIRERGALETFDLALQVTRRMAWPLVVTMTIGVAPLMLLNHWLIGWMSNVQFGVFVTSEESLSLVRFVYNMTLLVFIEAQLASIFATAYIGWAVFEERPKLTRVMGELRKVAGALIWSQMIVRGPLLAWLIVFVIPRASTFTWWEGLALPALALYAAGIRASRPFANEVIVLEGNPIRSRRGQSGQTIGKRMSALHSPVAVELIAIWSGAACVAVMLAAATYGTILFLSGTFLHDWSTGPWMIRVGAPMAMWIVAGYMAVVRFLNYLDVRIRLEGWEVELHMRGEAIRMKGPTAGEKA